MGKAIQFLKSEKFTLFSLLLTALACLIPGAGVLMAAVTTVESGTPTAQEGAAGVASQVPGEALTASNLQEAGGNAGDGLMQPDIDDDIFLIATDETVLDGIMRKVKRKVAVNGFEVDHYVIDERKAYATTTDDYTAAEAEQASLTVSSSDANYFQDNDTFIAKGVNGYSEDGQTEIEGSDLMLMCVGKDSSKMPLVIAVNGPKTSSTDTFCTIPDIPSGTELVFLANACAETQKEVAPNIVIPQPTRVYLQKMIMNNVKSDYFDKWRKRIPFAEATIAEAMVKEFRRKCNRSLWIGQKGKVKVDRGKLGNQFIYTTQGLRWQFTQEYEHTGDWTFADIISLAKQKFTGQDCSKKAIFLMGKDLLESLQNIDFSKQDITLTPDKVWGFEVTRLHTVFGDLYLKHEPTLDYIGYSNCGGIIDMDGLTRYYMKSEETSSEKIDGEEASREYVISINALALRGTSHIWVQYTEEETTEEETTEETE